MDAIPNCRFCDSRVELVEVPQQPSSFDPNPAPIQKRVCTKEDCLTNSPNRGMSDVP